MRGVRGSWHEDARRLYAEGVTVWAIANRFEVQWVHVAIVVNHLGYRDKMRDRQRKIRAAIRAPHWVPWAYRRDYVTFAKRHGETAAAAEFRKLRLAA